VNKKTKGIVAAAAGAALLAGSGATFALWYDTVALGTSGDSIQTGTLALSGGDLEGQWIWNAVSHENSNALIETETPLGNSELVPGDAVKWAWGADDIALTLIGKTLEAELILDGTFTATRDDISPLTVQVGTNHPTSSLQDALDQINDALTADSIVEAAFTNANGSGTIELPTIIVDFPTDPTDTGYGHRPGPLGTAYGRNQTSGQYLDLGALSIRLQQVVTPRS